MRFDRFEDMPDVLYVRDVARYLRLSERAVRHHIDTGALGHEKLGGRIIIPKIYLKTFVMGETADGATANS